MINRIQNISNIWSENFIFHKLVILFFNFLKWTRIQLKLKWICSKRLILIHALLCTLKFISCWIEWIISIGNFTIFWNRMFSIFLTGINCLDLGKIWHGLMPNFWQWHHCRFSSLTVHHFWKFRTWLLIDFSFTLVC